MNQTHVLCGIRIEPLRLAAWATYVGVIHNASPLRKTAWRASSPRFPPPIKS